MALVLERGIGEEIVFLKDGKEFGRLKVTEVYAFAEGLKPKAKLAFTFDPSIKIQRSENLVSGGR